MNCVAFKWIQCFKDEHRPENSSHIKIETATSTVGERPRKETYEIKNGTYVYAGINNLWACKMHSQEQSEQRNILKQEQHGKL